MSDEQLMPRAVELAGSLDALAALAAWMRVETESLEVDPRARRLLDEIVVELLGGLPATAGPAGAQVVGMVRAFLRQAVDLVEHPARTGDWAEVDEALLQGLGRLSGAIAGAIRAAEAALPGLGDGLSGEGARFLDVGTGTGWLAIAVARACPAAQVVGIDVFDTALDLARANVESEGLSDRIELVRLDAAELDEPAGYDAIWLPMPFLPPAVVPSVIAACAASLKPGGWLLPGTFAGSGDRLSDLLSDLRSVRSGGHPWQPDEIVGLLADAGLASPQEVPRRWPAPVRLYGAQAASRSR